MKRRLGIYVLQGKDGKADRYVEYFLSEISSELATLVIFCMGKTGESDRERLSRFTDIIMEDDGACDYPSFAAYGQALELFGKERANGYDEVVFMNDLIFGPIYPFEGCFIKMQQVKCDFWGMIRQDSLVDESGQVLEAYPQGSFLVVKNALVSSDAFNEFWEDVRRGPDEMGGSRCGSEKLERLFTQKMMRAGYTWDAYAKAAKYNTGKPGHNIDCSRYTAAWLIKAEKCPVIRSDVFADTGGLDIGFRGNAREVYDFLKQHTEYDVNLIWDHILRVYSIVDIKESMHLNYILSGDSHEPGSELSAGKKAVVILHMFYADLMDVCLEYLRNIPEEIDIIVTTNGERQKAYIEDRLRKMGRGGSRVLLAGRRGRDAGALLVTCKEFLLHYDYLCFIHDKKTTGSTGAVTIGESFMKHMWDNMLVSRQYIANILRLFEENDRLGLLTPPVPAMGGYLTELVGNEWTCCFQKTKELAKKMKLHVPIEEHKKPFALSTSFWCRTTALRPLFELTWQFEDFPEEPLLLDGTVNHAIERILIYVAQNEGYFSGIVQNSDYASLFMENISSVLSRMISDFREAVQYFSPLDIKGAFDNNHKIFALSRFCRKYPKIMIYGAGKYAKRIGELMDELGIEYEGFTVTRTADNPESLCRHPVIAIQSVLEKKEETGIVVALNKQNRSEVIPYLDEFEFEYFIAEMV